MKMLLDSSATRPRHQLASRSFPVRLGAFVLAVLFTAAQMPAQAAPVAAAQTATQQNSSANQSTGQAQATNAADSTQAALAASETTKGTAALPDAPAVSAGTSNSASLNMPPELKAMLGDANEESQNLQATPSTNHKVVQRPGMLVMGIAGVPLIVLGAMIFSLKAGSKETGFRDGVGTAFLAPGAAMSGLGFYFAFHKKNQ
jgi:cytoskeletal protein RodZ